jgi:hypothetical protein
MKIFLLPINANTRAFDLIEPASDKEMNIAPSNGELTTVKAADRAGADDRDARRRGSHPSGSQTQFGNLLLHRKLRFTC